MTHSRPPLIRAAASLAAVSALVFCFAPGCRQSGPLPSAQERSTTPVRREPVRQESAPAPRREELSRLNKGAQSETVYITESGKKYHRLDCKYLKSSRQSISRSKARASGHSACTVCDP